MAPTPLAHAFRDGTIGHVTQRLVLQLSPQIGRHVAHGGIASVRIRLQQSLDQRGHAVRHGPVPRPHGRRCLPPLLDHLLVRMR